VCLVIDGSSLESLWADAALQRLFIDIVRQVPTVIACRVSPLQKVLGLIWFDSGLLVVCFNPNPNPNQPLTPFFNSTRRRRWCA
jgi:hypothetical protein